MIQTKTFNDKRLDGYCIYCGNNSSSREHVPSKIFLDIPYPENLPIVDSCAECNQSFSLDEEYTACLIECMQYGSSNPELLSRNKIIKILKKREVLRKRIANSIKIVDNRIYCQMEINRVNNVLTKLAKGHLKFENSVSTFAKPKIVSSIPITLLSNKKIETFFSNEELRIVPEIGSRATQRIAINSSGIPQTTWLEVQENNYYYSVVDIGYGQRIRMFINNYLFAEVIFNEI